MARALLAHVPLTAQTHAAYRRGQLLRRYRARRESYHAACVREGLVYREKDTIHLVRERIAQRDYKPVLRRVGEVHTFAVIPRYGWHDHLYDELHALGPVTEFDYRALGFDVDQDFRDGSSTGRRRRAEMNAQLVEAFARSNEQRPVDWVFVYAQGVEISRRTVERITTGWGAPIVNMCLDDKQSWRGQSMGDHRAGQVDIASAFDLSWTSARVTCGWYLAEGARPVYLPEGCNPAVYRPLGAEPDIDVSFIGAAYGFRREVVRFLRRYGVNVATFGEGWGTRSVWAEDAVRIMCRSRINLGLGGIDYSEELTNVKTRDFEIPCTGGGVYLTSFNPDLAEHFRVGEEIACYRNRDEILELIRHYLAHDSERRRMAEKARQRCLAEHRWLHRYIRICAILGILPEGAEVGA